jgi:hypothetical protein
MIQFVRIPGDGLKQLDAAGRGGEMQAVENKLAGRVKKIL